MKLSVTPSRVSCCQRRLRLRAGFSLVELLVVIGIIAVLISLLMPALGSARERANALKCQSQQRQVLQAMFLNANNHGGYMALTGAPVVGFDPASLQDPRRVKYAYYQSDDGYHLMSIIGALAPMLGHAVRDDSLASVEEDMQRGVVREIFTCPSDIEGGRLGYTVMDGGAAYSSFAFSDAVFGWGSSLTADGSGLVSTPSPHSRLRGKLSRIPHPSETFLFTDAKPRSDGGWMVYCDVDADLTLRDFLVTTIGPANNPSASNTPPPGRAYTWDLIDRTRHRGHMDVAFADGHVEHVPITQGALAKISMNRDFPAN